MNASYANYDYKVSAKRIQEILDTPDINYEEKDTIPSRDKLTFTNGFYVNCTAMFVDMRDSSKLTDKYKRPTLARIYRSYLSELVAVMRDHLKVCEVTIQGDGVWGIFDTPEKRDIDLAFSVTAEISSMIDILNWKLSGKSIDPVEIGIGLSWGRALMIKAGHRGSEINDVIWMGDVVNEAASLSEYGNNSWWDRELFVSSDLYLNLNKHNQGLLEWNSTRQSYHGNIVDTDMNDWLEEQQNR